MTDHEPQSLTQGDSVTPLGRVPSAGSAGLSGLNAGSCSRSGSRLGSTGCGPVATTPSRRLRRISGDQGVNPLPFPTLSSFSAIILPRKPSYPADTSLHKAPRQRTNAPGVGTGVSMDGWHTAMHGASHATSSRRPVRGDDVPANNARPGRHNNFLRRPRYRSTASRRFAA